MSIFECADATEVEGVLQQVHEINGPVYIRMLRGDVPLLFPKEDGFGLKGGRLLASTGTCGVVSTGVCTQEAIRARSCLARRGAEIRHLHVNRIKPWPAQLVDEFLHGLSNVVSLENHSVIGGLGSAVAEQMASQGSGARLHRLGLQDTYAHGASKSYLMREYALDARALVDTLEPLLGRPFHITDEELETVEISTDRRLRAEDL
jgi:transketolase